MYKGHLMVKMTSSSQPYLIKMRNVSSARYSNRENNIKEINKQ